MVIDRVTDLVSIINIILSYAFVQLTSPKRKKTVSITTQKGIYKRLMPKHCKGILLSAI